MIQPILMSFAGEETMGWNPAKWSSIKKFSKKAFQNTPTARAYQFAKNRVPFMGEELPPKARINLRRQMAVRGKPEGVDAFGLSKQSIYYYMGSDGEMYLGKGKFLPGLTKAFKKVGKISSPITGAIAKSFLPAGVVNSLAKFDPSKKTTIQAATNALSTLIKPVAEVKAEKLTSTEMQALTKTALDPKVLMIAGGGALILLLLMMKRK